MLRTEKLSVLGEQLLDYKPLDPPNSAAQQDDVQVMDLEQLSEDQRTALQLAARYVGFQPILVNHHTQEPMILGVCLSLLNTAEVDTDQIVKCYSRNNANDNSNHSDEDASAVADVCPHHDLKVLYLVWGDIQQEEELTEFNHKLDLLLEFMKGMTAKFIAYDMQEWLYFIHLYMKHDKGSHKNLPWKSMKDVQEYHKYYLGLSGFDLLIKMIQHYLGELLSTQAFSCIQNYDGVLIEQGLDTPMSAKQVMAYYARISEIIIYLDQAINDQFDNISDYMVDQVERFNLNEFAVARSVGLYLGSSYEEVRERYIKVARQYAAHTYQRVAQLAQQEIDITKDDEVAKLAFTRMLTSKDITTTGSNSGKSGYKIVIKDKKSDPDQQTEERCDNSEMLQKTYEFNSWRAESPQELKFLYDLAAKDGRMRSKFDLYASPFGHVRPTYMENGYSTDFSIMGKDFRKLVTTEDPRHRLLCVSYENLPMRLLAFQCGSERLKNLLERNRPIEDVMAEMMEGVNVEDIHPVIAEGMRLIKDALVGGAPDHMFVENPFLNVFPRKIWIDKHYSLWPKFRDLMESLYEEAREEGRVLTLQGRPLWVKDKNINKQDFMMRRIHEPYASPWIASALELTKAALVLCIRELNRHRIKADFVHMEHNELLFEVPEYAVHAVSGICHKVMSNIRNINMPIKVNIGYGDTWYEASKSWRPQPYYLYRSHSIMMKNGRNEY